MNHQDAKRLMERDIAELVFLYSVAATKAEKHKVMQRLFKLVDDWKNRPMAEEVKRAPK